MAQTQTSDQTPDTNTHAPRHADSQTSACSKAAVRTVREARKYKYLNVLAREPGHRRRGRLVLKVDGHHAQYETVAVKQLPGARRVGEQRHRAGDLGELGEQDEVAVCECASVGDMCERGGAAQAEKKEGSIFGAKLV